MGECLAVCETGERAGGVLNGLANLTLQPAIDAALADGTSTVIRVPVGDSEAVEAGLACGGSASLSVLTARAFPANLWSAIADRTPMVVVTPVTEPAAPIVVTASGQLGASEGPSTAALHRKVDAVLARAHEILEKGRPQSTVEEIDGQPHHFALVAPIPNLLVVGVANLSNALERLGQFLGWTVCTRDERIASEADLAVADASQLGPTDGLVVLSHDLPASCNALAAAITGRCGYIGALGSRHTQTARADRLRETHQLDPADIARIHGPVGLDLGSRTPEETALAVFAEILAARSGRSAGSLRSASGPING